MPLEIKELHIKANICDNKNNQQGVDGINDQNQVERDTNILEMAVEKVLEILNERNER